MPTDAYRSNFFAVKKLCLLVSISSSPLSPFAHETLMLDNQCCHCSSSSSTRWRWCMLALMTDDCRSSSYGVNEHLHHLTHFYLQSISLFGTDLSPMLANEHGYTTRLQRHDHFLHYFHILKICTDNLHEVVEHALWILMDYLLYIFFVTLCAWLSIATSSLNPLDIPPVSYISLTTLSRIAIFRHVTATRAPIDARRRDIDFPIPLFAPVTNITLSVKSMCASW